MGAGAQQRLVDGLLVGEADALGGKRQQRRAATGQQENHPVALFEVAHQLQHATGDALAGVIRHGMRGLDHLDLAAVGTVAVTRDHETREVAFPRRLDGFGHGRRGFAGTDDDGAAAAVCREMVGQHLARVGRVDGGGEKLAQQGLWIEGHLMLLV